MGVEPTEEKPWTIFLSYFHKDEPCADWLYDNLRSANLPVWYKRREVLIGDSILESIGEGLEGSELLVVVISQRAVKSNWVKAELEPKILQQIERQQVAVLPVVIDDTDPEEISIYLKGRKWINIPCEGSEQKFEELLKNIEEHLKRRGILNPLDSLCKPNIPPASQNPYGSRVRVLADRFIVSEGLVKDVTENIIKSQSISIVGARMMGKTSLLNFLASPLCQTYYQKAGGSRLRLRFVYLDLQEFSGRNRYELVLELARGVSTTASGHFNGSTYRDALDWIKTTTGRRNAGSPLWLLLLDEFDRVIELDRIDKGFFDDLRSLSQNYNLCYMIASCRKLLDLPLPQNVKSSPFFNMFKKYFLSVWDASTAENLIFKPYGKELGIFNEADFAYLMHLTASHPMLLQIACEHLYKIRYTDEKKAGEYDQLLRSYMKEAEDVYSYYWNHELNNTERKWLKECWLALSQKGDAALEELQQLTLGRKNRAILIRLRDLGLLMSQSDPLEIPKGLDLFLKEILNP
jgi:TIR domain